MWFSFVGGLIFIIMRTLRDRIVDLSKELAECTDESTRRKLKRQIALLKEQMSPTEPKRLGDLMKGIK